MLSAILLFLAVHQAKVFRAPEYILAISICFVMLVSFHANSYDLAILTLPARSPDISSSTETSSGSRGRHAVHSSCTLYVVVLAFSTVGPLAILPAWLWYGITLRRGAVETGLSGIAMPALPVPPSLAGVLTHPEPCPEERRTETLPEVYAVSCAQADLTVLDNGSTRSLRSAIPCHARPPGPVDVRIVIDHSS